MNTKQFSLGIALLAVAGIAYSQEFVVTQTQTNNQASCQENCPSEGQGGQNAMQIDRSGMDKASVHLQVLQQTSQKFAEPSNNKKNNDDKKAPNKPQDNS
ncbi:hypothetical protein H8K52_08170 [Undibacterium seohonense]|jgi:hypothetical protein|uniref:Secreted protein n=1 Tax=Undibacterium seohonense TaxID=1344950 RepID=A0ABR6X318_9BURK|nr:hypothetical protein [Undibacterium seohonense]MBC3807317.1 hypothetical protein [Undibacterium seohonense]